MAKFAQIPPWRACVLLRRCCQLRDHAARADSRGSGVRRRLQRGRLRRGPAL